MDNLYNQSSATTANEAPFSLIPILEEFSNTLEKSTNHREFTQLVWKGLVGVTSEYSRLIVELDKSEDVKTKDSDVQSSYFLKYQSPEFFKDFLLAHRDTVLQLNIGHHKTLETKATEEQFKSLFKLSKEHLLEISLWLRDQIGRNNIQKGKRFGTIDISAVLQHQSSPWPVYEGQFGQIIDQIKYLNQSNGEIENWIGAFSQIKSSINQIMQGSLVQVQNYVASIQNAIEQLPSEIAPNKGLQIVDGFLEKMDLNEEITSLDIPEIVEQNSRNLQKIDIVTASDDGFLIEKKLDFNKTVKRWIDLELLPQLIDFWEYQGRAESLIKSSLFNVRNRFSMAQDQQESNLQGNHLGPLEQLSDNLSKISSSQKDTLQAIKRMLDEEFLVTKVYGKGDFLEVSIQSSLSQYSADTESLFSKLLQQGKSIFKGLDKSYKSGFFKKEGNLLEQAISAISYRTAVDSNAHYDAIFLNRTFTGDFFVVPREEDEIRLKNALAQWDEGFAKSFLITGEPLCGKTTFLQHSLKKFCQEQILFLEPNGILTLEGRKFKTTYSLKVTFSEILKSSYSRRVVLVIDNLELWRDDKTPFLENVRALLDFLDNAHKDYLVVVATSNHLSHYLTARLGFYDHFSNVLDITALNEKNIVKALLLRHGASHRTLIDKNGEVLQPKEIHANISRLCRRFDNNIGEILQAWTYGTSIHGTDEVRYEYTSKELPDFLTSYEAIVLKHLILYRHIDERSLKEYVGKNFNDTFRSALKRLANVRVLERKDDGKLWLNPIVAHDIIKILKYRDLIK